ncbi:hypothetical protein [Alcanivorax sp. 1008]|uniref:hypothetical protein n=1 Tax=Alcanivorax sp. 1008 TaxID=2816853 RepID=UPI001DDA0FE8|nr:hypothetical protein [Alcanivorax sp. 1008]MCC1497929.1 hypothetical protein [Alcanivorax sp. 1008]
MNILRLISVIAVAMPLVAQAAPVSADDGRELCQAAAQDGALEVMVDNLMASGRFDYDMAPELLTLDCGGVTLIQSLINQAGAENLEFAVIDLGIDVNDPLVPVEAGALSVVQYLMQQAVLAPNPEARQFAMEYMQDFRSVDFNPNLQLVTLK